MPISAPLLLLTLPAALTTSPTAAPATCSAVVCEQQDDKALKALVQWLKLYRNGKIKIMNREFLGKRSLVVKFDLATPGEAADMTRKDELTFLLEKAAAQNDTDAAKVMLPFAAIGLDQGRIEYTFEMAPFTVRKIAEKELKKLSSEEARDYLTKVARGDIKTDKAFGSGMRAAALRYQGMNPDPNSAKLLAEQLEDEDLPVRLAAIEALGTLAKPSSVGVLSSALKNEEDEAALIGIVQALRKCFTIKGDGSTDLTAKASAKTELPAAAGIAVRAAINTLGQASWRCDMELVQFLGNFQSAEVIPALIAILQQYHDHPEQIASGKLSGLLLQRAHETLVGMTGAVFPANRPDLWQKQWLADREKMLVAQNSKPVALPEGEGTISTKKFCGIPVVGTRILFVVDLSGSMGLPMQVRVRKADGIATEEKTRLFYAKQQLKEALDSLPENSQFNLITYNGNPKAKHWNKQLVKATKKSKDRAKKFIDGMRADGGTNMWSGMGLGLKMKSLVYGARYDSAVDEMFVLSDGAPNLGDVIDPVEILELTTETNRFNNVRINTVYISSPHEQNPDSATLSPIDLMRRMAEKNGGRFVEVEG
ncbi:MAG: HEAT repeat domain-containing protein [Planctomycetota bacterium]|nr:HEAT repeat domain-containing protein [Planctomycetota bacterium]